MEDWTLLRNLRSLRIHAGVGLTRLSILTPLVTLRDLRLVDNQELQETPDLGGLQTVVTLHIRGSPRWSGEREVGKMEQLRSLDLAGSGISDLTSLRNLDKLHTLDTSCTGRLYDVHPLRLLPGLLKVTAYRMHHARGWLTLGQLKVLELEEPICPPVPQHH